MQEKRFAVELAMLRRVDGPLLLCCYGSLNELADLCGLTMGINVVKT